MRSAYFVPTPEASLTAAAARGLQGLGCGGDCSRCNAKCPARMGQFPLVPAVARSAKLAWYLPGVPSPSNLSWFGDRLPPGLGDLGAGAGSGRFNRAVARGIYTLPFTSAPGQGGAGLGQLEVSPGLLLSGIGLLALGMFLLGGKHGPRIRRRRAARLRRKLRELES